MSLPAGDKDVDIDVDVMLEEAEEQLPTLLAVANDASDNSVTSLYDADFSGENDILGTCNAGSVELKSMLFPFWHLLSFNACHVRSSRHHFRKSSCKCAYWC